MYVPIHPFAIYPPHISHPLTKHRSFHSWEKEINLYSDGVVEMKGRRKNLVEAFHRARLPFFIPNPIFNLIFNPGEGEEKEGDIYIPLSRKKEKMELIFLFS